MGKILRNTIFLLAATFCCRCVYDFDPVDFWGRPDDIVIEGDILVGDTSYFQVSKPLGLSEQDHEYIMNAEVWVEDSDGQRWTAEAEPDAKHYVLNTTELSVDGSYKLCVEIPERGRYESAMQKVMISPPIDSISYTVAKDRTSVAIEISTRNRENPDEILYCKWDYEEDWQFRAKYLPRLNYISYTDTMLDLSPEEQLERYICWDKNHDSKSIISSSETMAGNIIYREKIQTLYSHEDKCNYLYHIRVKQTAMNEEGYMYWEVLRRNQEETGGLFGRQPSDQQGNIRSVTNEGEVALGYINVTTVSYQSRYIDCTQLGVHRYRDDAKLHSISTFWRRISQIIKYVPICYSTNPDGTIVSKAAAWWTADPSCLDCRLRGGTNIRPSFWLEQDLSWIYDVKTYIDPETSEDNPFDEYD